MFSDLCPVSIFELYHNLTGIQDDLQAYCTCSVLLLKFRMVSRYVTAVNLFVTLERGRSSLKLKNTGTVDNIKNYGLHSLRSGGQAL